ncbi:hypothetical protein CANTEDRAFT_112782 [Yamadazyma tenuis ATCC 10573]|uniref:PQ-loop-domain-containing protein n=1 Tax=Candida tenuis (strain ATCC 10573 / BCRC 21748 / CBS 615 / JCM 9827 / NBRC 10315 / NRRL Y-1498 / VKM Y-70) TaxID=590646 RepID=G3AYQ8_CANTC|nr:PQ-loop-domain-containing protein [Yamadazyma tenuis ATCC 10573]XP_006684813.1 uncharacterized protein CANTEDRAFT_112782 [Yamadazyma tenuis ATCC 10573]EGV66238.1 PQ-loop-domain-containing protein [Yamadazyma tenuis ATCC 10573]EGV66239.1 hypothetical protein CANTEDRAFT_112782 [Yamadazyma tenuis ATCC 10573]
MVDCSGWSLVSNCFSSLSLASWIFAQLPQIITNYRNQSAEGISPTFLLLWFMGDFLSFSSCLLNDVVLKFQLYLSLFFILNDITLCTQYYYYNSVYPKHHGGVYTPLEIAPEAFDSASIHADDNSVHVRHHAVIDSNSSSLSPSGKYDSTGSSPVQKTIVTASLVGIANSLPILTVRADDTSVGIRGESLGIFLAWCCTVVYIASRCPQLLKNYQRKSVDGINSILFGAALLGNLTYTFSILTSCEFVNGDNKSIFFMKELPYILGSAGTCIFDFLYFYQRRLYRNAGKETIQMRMDNFEGSDSEVSRTSYESSSLM